MIVVKTRKWGNSVGIVLPKEELDRLKIDENQEIIITIEKKENPLKELYGAGRHNKIGPKLLKEMRKGMESKYL